MKSVRVHAFTERPEDLRIDELPAPVPGPGQVRVRMLMSPVNPSDFHFIRGIYYRALERVIWNQKDAGTDRRVWIDPGRGREIPVPPYTLGGEGVGIVEACGGGFLAKRLMGKRVAVAAGGPPNGLWQESAVVEARRVIPVDASLPDEQASMYLINPISAYVMVREVLKVPRDGWLLLTAAGSALGKSVVRMGRHYGFRTICVVRSDANTAELVSLGADAVIETDKHDLFAEVYRATGGKGASHALDCVGGQLTADIVRCLGLDGRLVLYGTMADSPVQVAVRDLMMPLAGVEGFYLGNWMPRQSPFKLLGVLRAVKKLTALGIFHTEVGEIFPIERAADAVTASLQSGRTGKVMLRIGKS
jgi:NADPH2:quinone reductase